MRQNFGLALVHAGVFAGGWMLLDGWGAAGVFLGLLYGSGFFVGTVFGWKEMA